MDLGERLEYELRSLDFARFWVLNQFLSPLVQGAVLLPVLLFVAGVFGHRPANWITQVISWYGGFWLASFIFSYFLPTSLANLTQLARHTVTVAPTSFIDETRHSRTEFFWPSVHKVVSRPGFVAIYLAGDMVHVIPNRAFSSAEQRARFIGRVRERIAAEKR